MYQCTFTLNDKAMSTFEIAGRSFSAFSGLEPYVNKRMQHCLKDLGPIPLGTYYIVDRESGGRLGWLREFLGRRKDWFALYADDGRIDDVTFCDQVKRGNFRLHPAVGTGISKGCITIKNEADFYIIKGLLQSNTRAKIPATDIKTYGKVTVR